MHLGHCNGARGYLSHLYIRPNGIRRIWTCREAIQLNNRVNAMVYTSEAPEDTRTTNGLPLEGFSIAIKDNFCTSSMPTTCSSAMLREFKSPFDATVVETLRKSGADIVGKTNCDEFGMGSLNIHSIHGPVINPHNMLPTSKDDAANTLHLPEERERRSAGGSSGGSAAAVLAGMCDVALATDTGGSTRLPASYCGVVGFKPSYGLVSRARWGVVSFADSLDCVGIMGKDVGCTEQVFHNLSFYDPKDPTAATADTRAKASQVAETLYPWKGDGDIVGVRIGIPQEYFPRELDPSVLPPIRNIIMSLKEAGAVVVPVSLPSTSFALSAYYVIASAEASSNMARYDGVRYGMQVDGEPGDDRTKTANVYARTRSKGFGREVQKRILLGTYALTADAFDNYFLQAQRIRIQVRKDFDRVFRMPNVLSSKTAPTHPPPFSEPHPQKVDFLLHPSAIRTAPPLTSSPLFQRTSLDSYVQDVLTVPASLAGLPALSVHAGVADDGWPIGVSVVGQWGCDGGVMRIGSLIEKFERS